MRVETFLLNNPPGSFLVKAADGSRAFDSRLPTQRLYLTGAANLTGPSSAVAATTLWVPYGKTFAKIPYVRAASRVTSAAHSNYDAYKNYYPPQLSWTYVTTSGAQFFSGNYTAARTDGVFLGNAHQTPGGTTSRHIYAAFENPVE